MCVGITLRMKNEKFTYCFLLFVLIFLFLVRTAAAQSKYVLPYPSSMPGNFAYKLHVIFEHVSKYWYFGDFGQSDYNLKLSDKYLVEAKTLFEYRQYLLGQKALKISDEYFARIASFLEKVSSKKKDVSNKRAVLKEASLKHIEILEIIDRETPDIFNWQPEKATSTSLYLKKDIENAINIRKNNF